MAMTIPPAGGAQEGTRAGAALRPPAPPTECKIERLQEPEGSTMSIVTAADPTGRRIASRGYPDGGDFKRSVVIWDDGMPTRVDIPGEDQLLRDINTAGVAVGASFDPQTFGPLTPWIYRNGKVSALLGAPRC
jgi:hypothetical protein